MKIRLLLALLAILITVPLAAANAVTTAPVAPVVVPAENVVSPIPAPLPTPVVAPATETAPILTPVTPTVPVTTTPVAVTEAKPAMTDAEYEKLVDAWFIRMKAEILDMRKQQCQCGTLPTNVPLSGLASATALVNPAANVTTSGPKLAPTPPVVTTTNKDEVVKPAPTKKTVSKGLSRDGVHLNGAINGDSYIVGRGDVLWEIAYVFRWSTSKLAIANKLRDPDLLNIGDLIRIKF